jgi:glucuronate isomerase
MSHVMSKTQEVERARLAVPGDSRSLLSYTRHEYFRRILCNRLGTEMHQGLLPDDVELVGAMVRDICYYNAERYFGFQLPG